MNSHRLIQDVSDCISGNNPILPNRLDASLVLISNLLTNTLSGDFKESNLDIFLDRNFLTLLSKKKVGGKLYGVFESLFSYGLFLLLNRRSLRDFPDPEESTILRAVLIESYRVALPLGDWDNFPIRSLNSLSLNGEVGKEMKSSNQIILAFRPDLSEIINNPPVLSNWFRSNGFYELPLFRTSLREDIVQGKTSFDVIGPAGTGYCYQELGVSAVPQESDLFFHGIEFRRWLCLPGSLLIFKDEDTEKIRDKRWLYKETTFIIKSGAFGSSIKMSVATVGVVEPIYVNIHGADRGKDKHIGSESTSFLFVEISASKWVEYIRITISCNCPYVVNLN